MKQDKPGPKYIKGDNYSRQMISYLEWDSGILCDLTHSSKTKTRLQISNTFCSISSLTMEV